jgi:hypothetical protein
MATTEQRKARSLGQVFSAQREALDPMPSYEAIAKRLMPVEASHTTVAKYHADVVRLPDIEIVQALMDFYGMSLKDLPDDVRFRCERVRDGLVAASHRRRKETGIIHLIGSMGGAGARRAGGNHGSDRHFLALVQDARPA